MYSSRSTLNDQVKEDEIDRTYSMHGDEEECIYDSGGNARKKETTRKI
jgi:hypothetical protein